MSHRLLPLALALVPVWAAAGCGRSNEAPVSGTVYMDGKPLPGVHVVFQPLGTKDNPNPGRGSTGQTDENGRYTLRIDGERDGAVVGKHRVAIATVMPGEGANFDPETGSPDGAPAQAPEERISERYNEKTILTFDVPKGGTDKADFRLESNSR